MNHNIQPQEVDNDVTAIQMLAELQRHQAELETSIEEIDTKKEQLERRKESLEDQKVNLIVMHTEVCEAIDIIARTINVSIN